MPKLDNMTSYIDMVYLNSIIKKKRLKYKDIALKIGVKPNTMHTYFYNMRMPKDKYKIAIKIAESFE